MRSLNDIKAITHASQRLDIDVQRPSGCYHMPRLGDFTLCYKNVVNVIARLGAASVRAENTAAVLVNCHFDTWPGSPGASDDGVSCALMLEMLRVYAIQSTPMDHDVIFLFNGAEENILMAAHGFITQHPWRHTIRAFVNLEAAGAGGREMLFQVGVLVASCSLLFTPRPVQAINGC
jgi:Zn-dependent M28 family amino/carboxypeptidase